MLGIFVVYFENMELIISGRSEVVAFKLKRWNLNVVWNKIPIFSKLIQTNYDWQNNETAMTVLNENTPVCWIKI